METGCCYTLICFVSLVLVIVSTPLQVSPIFPITLSVFIPVFSLCLLPVRFLCQVNQRFCVSAPAFPSLSFSHPPGFDPCLSWLWTHLHDSSAWPWAAFQKKRKKAIYFEFRYRCPSSGLGPLPALTCLLSAPVGLLNHCLYLGLTFIRDTS